MLPSTINIISYNTIRACTYDTNTALTRLSSPSACVRAFGNPTNLSSCRIPVYAYTCEREYDTYAGLNIMFSLMRARAVLSPAAAALPNTCVCVYVLHIKPSLLLYIPSTRRHPAHPPEAVRT